MVRAERGGGKAAFDRAKDALREVTDLVSRRQKMSMSTMTWQMTRRMRRGWSGQREWPSGSWRRGGRQPHRKPGGQSGGFSCSSGDMSSWQSCTGDAAPRVVNMHGGKGGVHVRGGRCS